MTAAEFQPDITPKKTRDGFPCGGPKVMPGRPDTYVAYGRGWANVSNTPFREYKHWVHEGGISTPLIAHWPRESRRKASCEATRPPDRHHGDLRRPSGREVPQGGRRDQAITPLEGRSLVPAFADKPIDRDAIYWEHEGNRAVRVGDWKLVAEGPAGGSGNCTTPQPIAASNKRSCRRAPRARGRNGRSMGGLGESLAGPSLDLGASLRRGGRQGCCRR